MSARLVKCEVLEFVRSTDVRGDFTVEGCCASRVAEWAAGTVARGGVHICDLIIGSGGTKILVLNRIYSLAIPVAIDLLRALGAQISEDRSGGQRDRASGQKASHC